MPTPRKPRPIIEAGPKPSKPEKPLFTPAKIKNKEQMNLPDPEIMELEIESGKGSIYNEYIRRDGHKYFQLTPTKREVAINAYKMGLTLKEVGGIIGCDQNTILSLFEAFPQFRIEMDAAKAQDKAIALQRAHKRAFPEDMSLIDKPETSLTIFLLKTKYGMRENDAQVVINQQNNVEGSNFQNNLQVTFVNPGEELG